MGTTTTSSIADIGAGLQFDGDTFAALLAATFTRLEQTVLTIFLVLLGLLLLGVAALIISLWCEARARRTNAAYRTAVESRLTQEGLR